MVAIYARQSIDKKDSISIETQIESCKRLISPDEEYTVYSDKGWSGKNMDRPEFTRLRADIENGLITKIIVYKLDRISRSLYDFAGLVEVFQKYNVEFVSTVETFDTSSAIGRAMLGIIMGSPSLNARTFSCVSRTATTQEARRECFWADRLFTVLTRLLWLLTA